MNKLEAALKEWATKYARCFAEHGAPEGQHPTAWCNEVLLDSIVEDEKCMDELFIIAADLFVAACKEQSK